MIAFLLGFLTAFPALGIVAVAFDLHLRRDSKPPQFTELDAQATAEELIAAGRVELRDISGLTIENRLARGEAIRWAHAPSSVRSRSPVTSASRRPTQNSPRFFRSGGSRSVTGG